MKIMQEQPLRGVDPEMGIEIDPGHHFDVSAGMVPMQLVRSDESMIVESDISTPEADNEERELFEAMAIIKNSVVDGLEARGALQGTQNENLRTIDDALGANQAFCTLREQVTERYTRLVRSLSRKTADRLASKESSDKYDEAFQTGYLALIKAANRFDVNRTYGEDGKRGKFISYAVTYINGEVAKYYRDRSGICRTAYEMLPAIVAAEVELRNNGVYNPAPKDLADIMGITEQEVRQAQNTIQAAGAVSLEALSERNEDDSPLTIKELATESDEAAIDDRMAVTEVLKSLPEREQLIFSRLAGGHKQAEIGQELGISQMHVSRLWKHARIKLMESLEPQEHSIEERY